MYPLCTHLTTDPIIFIFVYHPLPQAQNIILFAVGVGNEIDSSELESIANKPSSTYVLYAENYAAIANIRDKLEQKLCEGE